MTERETPTMAGGDMHNKAYTEAELAIVRDLLETRPELTTAEMAEIAGMSLRRFRRMIGKLGLRKKQVALKSALTLNIADRAARGRTAEEIAAEFGVKISTVYGAAIKAGVAVSGERRGSVRGRIILAYAPRKTAADIAGEAGFSENRVRHVLADAGLSPRPPHVPADDPSVDQRDYWGSVMAWPADALRELLGGRTEAEFVSAGLADYLAGDDMPDDVERLFDELVGDETVGDGDDSGGGDMSARAVRRRNYQAAATEAALSRIEADRDDYIARILELDDDELADFAAECDLNYYLVYGRLPDERDQVGRDAPIWAGSVTSVSDRPSG